MAIGDAIAAFLGTATTNRQPSAGVEEQIGSMAKDGTTDTMNVYDGTTQIQILSAAARPDVASSEGGAYDGGAAYNMAFMITNTIYLRKAGSTDRVYVGGVQTND